MFVNRANGKSQIILLNAQTFIDVPIQGNKEVTNINNEDVQ